MTLATLRALTYCSLCLALAASAYVFARVRPLARPTLGILGLRRAIALESNPGFVAIEPLLRWLGAVCASAPLSSARENAAALLTRAGDPLGLSSDELFALSILTAACGAALAAFVIGAEMALPAALLGAALPWLRMRSLAEQRVRAISRELPPVINLLALAMSASLDFTGAIERLVREFRGQRRPLCEELERLLQQLATGSTRRKALLDLAVRAPSPSVRDFVAAVVQAEAKGNPIADVLAIQARMLRMRRSVAAEEAAARAAVMLIMPMMLLLGAVVLLMLGPFVVNGMGF